MSKEELSVRQARITSHLNDARARLKALGQSVMPSLAESMPEPTSVTALEAAAAELESWRMAQARLTIESICGATDDSVDVERYKGGLGASIAFVRQHEPPVAQIQWYANLQSRLGSNATVGTVNDLRWCTGTLIADNVLLTAGHCFDVDSNGHETPKRAGKSLPPIELAKLMKVNFNYQLPPSGVDPRPSVEYPITKLIEHREGIKKLDYAIAELGKGSDGEFPGKRFGVGTVDAGSAALDEATLLTIIQHPKGLPKRIAAGSRYSLTPPNLSYSDIDTEGGASGSGVLNLFGRIVAVHVLGGCEQTGGANQGVTLNSIRPFSAYLQNKQ